MTKMSKPSTKDSISDLPDSVLLYILSFLETEEVVRTSVLSKRWRYIWTSVPALKFVCHGYDRNDIAKFVTRVDTALCHFQQTSIEKFKIDCFNGSGIDNWSLFAANKKVGELNLHYDGYYLPESVCCNSYLRKLSLYGCDFEREACISWPSLKSLSLESMYLNFDIVEKILRGCPMLEFLKMIDCVRFESVESKTLREVVMATKDGEYMEFDELKISAPNLQILHLNNVVCNHFEQVNVPALVRAKLNFSHPVYWDVDPIQRHSDNFMGFLGSISHVKELKLGDWFMQGLSSAMFVWGARALTLKFSCLTFLKVNLSRGKWDVLGLITLLKCSPNLDTLIVQSVPRSKPSGDFLQRAKDYWRKECWRSFWKGEFPLPHLKTVKFLRFRDMGDVDKYIHALVRFLLKNAGHLGSITISGEEFQMILNPVNVPNTSR